MEARSRLARHRVEKPATKARQIRALRPDIEAALGVGQSMKTNCAWLAEDAGITPGVTSLTSYISRIRRREGVNRRTAVGLPSGSRPISADARSASVPMRAPILQSQKPTTPYAPGSSPDFDPLANVRQAGEAAGFDYRPLTATT